jgi:hypothetical protein
MDHLDRITQSPGVMGGKACIRGMRVTVGMDVGQIGAGHSMMTCWRPILTLNAKTFCERCAMRRGDPKNAKSLGTA